ncbi:MAG: ATP-dependent helicase, partial [Lachnospiraceae bacterium]|nr:ATP-dependent helicase [Lachnospiraceae bacterium]
DTSIIQHFIIALLASMVRNLFLVGDEDLSMYGFRAAYPDALLHFEQDHPGARVLYMERNYRSDANIVQAADRFISQNILRHKKSMLPTKPGTIAVQTIALKSRGAQYSYLGKVAADCQTETAVLYRYNESVLPLVDLLERKEIPYRIRNADFSFFKSRIVRDITDILSLSIDPCDTGRFMRVYYKMKLFLKKEEATKACQESQQRDLPILEAAIRFVDCSPQKKRQLQDQQRLLQKLGQERGDRAIRQVVNDLGYGEYLERNHMNDRKVLLLQLLGKNEASPADFLNRLDYLNQILQEKAPDPDCPFILSTIHSSKGLEYETVFLMDAADGIFPETIPQSLKRMDPKERQEYEEERRLFYVGVTRAKSRLFLFSFGRKSSFIEQLLKKKNDAAPKPPEKRKATKRPAYGRQRTYSKPIVSEEALLEFVRSLGEGIIVTHKKYGKGAVSALSDKQVVIHFDAGDKTFDLSALYASKTLEIE